MCEVGDIERAEMTTFNWRFTDERSPGQIHHIEADDSALQ